jgi:hypothetical protein
MIGKTILYEILAGISKLIFARNTYFTVVPIYSLLETPVTRTIVFSYNKAYALFKSLIYKPITILLLPPVGE